MITGEIIGGCKIEEQIGAGGFGTVYKAVQLSLDRIVAVKFLQRGLSESPEALQAFEREARCAAKLEHPNIVPVYNYGCESGAYFLVMEYVEGKTLEAALREQGRFGMPETLKIAEQIASALEYAHDHGTIHGDLNPGNIILASDGRAIVGDFFGCHPLGNDLERSVVGVPEYISPEQARGLRSTAKSDIYSLGIILYEMLTGQPPFSELNPSDTLFQHISAEPDRPSKANPDVSKQMDELILHLLAKNPQERPDDCSEIADKLTLVKSTMNSKKRRRERRERPPVNKAAAAALLALIGALGGVVYLIGMSIAAEKELDMLAKQQPSKASYASAQMLEQSVVTRYNAEMQRGQKLLIQGSYRSAATAFHRACKLRPDQLEPHMYLGAIFVQREDYKMAEIELKAAIKLDPGNDKAKSTLRYVQSKLRPQPVTNASTPY